MSAQRRDNRLPAKLAFSYRTQGAFLVAYSVNLSKGGIFLESSEALPIGTEVTLQLDVADAGQIELVGQVAWVRQGSPDGLPDGMGIQLRELDERYGGMIDRMVEDFIGITVLVVAGTSDRLSLLGRYVRSIMTCEILEATNQSEADAGLAAGPDLVVLDVDRSNDFGVHTVESIKQADETRMLPVILLAGDLRARELAKQAGADEVLEAPPSFAALQAAVIRTLSRPSKVEP
jgi:uncharacterized protein (TIGR02266 family)